MNTHVDTHDTTPRETGRVTRREVLGGGLLLGTFLLAGCHSGGSAGQPGSGWSDSARSATPVVPPVAAGGGIPARPDIYRPDNVVTRTQWTRMGVARPSEINPMNGINRITVHHSAVDNSGLRNPSDTARMIEGIRAGHVGRGWADIGYHYVIDPSGKIWEGRSTRFQGAHVEFNNEHNLGIVVLGNFETQSPSPQAVRTLDRFVASQMARFAVPLRRVYTHQELKRTLCPGRSLQRYMLASRGRGGGLVVASA